LCKIIVEWKIILNVAVVQLQGINQRVYLKGCGIGLNFSEKGTKEVKLDIKLNQKVLKF